MLKSKSYHCLTFKFVILQIYSQYVEVQDAFQQEKTENTRLKMYLDQILKVHMYSNYGRTPDVFDTFLVFQASLIMQIFLKACWWLHRNNHCFTLQEIEEKAPVLLQQRRDYEQALHSVDKLTKRLDLALVVSWTTISINNKNYCKI